MEEKKPIAYFIGENPLRALEWVIWPILLIAGAYIISPFFETTGGTSPNGALAAAGSLVAIKIYGAIVGSIGLSGLFGLVTNRPWYRKAAATAIFFIFIYFTLLRIIIMPTNIGWTTYFINALLAAGIRLRIRWEELTNDGTAD